MELNKLYLGDCIEVMKGFEDNCIDSIVTDPPYGIGFMGKEWDTFNPEFINEQMAKDKRPHTQIASQRRSNTAGTYDYSRNKEFQQWFTIFSKECLRVLKPGGHLLSFGGTRTYHRMVCAIEDAGFEIRDCLQWLYASGFPKNLDISKQIDKMNNKHLIDLSEFGNYIKEKRIKTGYSLRQLDDIMGTNTAASWWEGRKSGVQLPSLKIYKRLKEVLELNNKYDYLIEWAEAEREIIGEKIDPDGKPRSNRLVNPCLNANTWNLLNDKEKLNKATYQTVPLTPEAKQWDGYGTALKPACEIIVMARKPISEKNIAENVLKWGTGGINIDGCRIESGNDYHELDVTQGNDFSPTSWNPRKEARKFKPGKGRWPANVIFDEEAAELLDEISGERKAGGKVKGHEPSRTGDRGIYSKWDRVENNPFYDKGGASRFFYVAKASKAERNAGLEGFEKGEVKRQGLCGEHNNPSHKNNHPTVKPIKLLRYLVRLITPLGGICLDPFIGSGTTAIACIEEGFDYIGIEKEKDYFDIAEKRIFHYKRQLKLWKSYNQ